MKEKQYISRAISEASSKVAALDDDFNATERVSRLVYEDDRKKLIEDRDKLLKKRDSHSLIFILAIAAIFVTIFFFL